MATVSDNPFPAKAVTTFGGAIQAYADLKFMREAERPMLGYLKSYPATAPTLALSGGHGTGKTYLLGWLARTASDLQSAGARILYAKTNGPDLMETYQELVRNLTRRQLLEIVNAGLMRHGRSRVDAAMATRTESAVIEKTGSMDEAFKDKVLDFNELHLELRDVIAGEAVASAVSQKVASAIGLLEDPQYGEPAFDWIAGMPATLPNESLQAPLFGSSKGDNSQVAVDALETIAALFKAAEIPLIVMLDQVENFIPADNIPAASSIIKKLAEQLGERSAMVIMAGTPAAWDNLPRDLWHRFHGRTPLPVGSLTFEETDVLLDAYLPKGTNIPAEHTRQINDLTGGNSRETLQVAHRAWTLANGDPDALTAEMLVAAARDSGSLDDRFKLARQMLREVVAAERRAMWPIDSSDDEIPIWAVEAKSGARLAVAITMAADARAEAQLAQRVTSARRNMEAAHGIRDVLVAAVGYSSEKVQSLLKGIATTIVFRESSFKADLAKQIGSMLGGQGMTDPAPDPRLQDQLSRLEAALAEVERAREAAEQSRAEALARQTESLAAPERQETEVRTRIQLREGLDNLARALASSELGDERLILRHLMIDNESYVRNSDFEYLGDIYFDIIDLVNIANHLPVLPIDGIITKSAQVRSEIISAMRATLSSTKQKYANTNSFRITLSMFGGTLPSIIVFLLFMDRQMVNFEGEVTGPSLLEAVLVSIVIGAVVGLLCWLFVSITGRPEFRYSKYRNFLQKMRDRLSADK